MPTPPTPPRFDPRPTPLQQRLLLGLFGAGAVLALVGYLFDFGLARLLQRGGWFLLCYAFVVGTSWLPPSILSRRVDAFLDRWIKTGATGFYGVMALATYAHLELRTFVESVVEFEFGSDLVRDTLMQWVMGFSVDSLKNFVMAMAWPATLWGKQATGLAPVILVAASWGVYEIGRRLLPQRERTEATTSKASARGKG